MFRKGSCLLWLTYKEVLKTEGEVVAKEAFGEDGDGGMIFIIILYSYFYYKFIPPIIFIIISYNYFYYKFISPMIFLLSQKPGTKISK